MKRGLVSACAALLVGSGWTLAQAPVPTSTTQPAKPAVRPVQANGQDLQGGIVTPGATVPSGPLSPGAPGFPGAPPSGVYGPGTGPTGPYGPGPGGPPGSGPGGPI